jgi:hypothetical protein
VPERRGGEAGERAGEGVSEHRFRIRVGLVPEPDLGILQDRGIVVEGDLLVVVVARGPATDATTVVLPLPLRLRGAMMRQGQNCVSKTSRSRPWKQPNGPVRGTLRHERGHI